MDDQITNRADGGTRYRMLRIAWSVGWGIVCLVLIALWVSSYSVWHSPYGPVFGRWKVQINSLGGSLFVGADRVGTPRDYPWNWRTFRLTSHGGWGPTERSVLGIGTFVSKQNPSSPMRFVYAPYWLLAMAPAMLAGAPWGPWRMRFGLRTLLIAMAIVAVLLGLVVWGGI